MNRQRLPQTPARPLLSIILTLLGFAGLSVGCGPDDASASAAPTELVQEEGLVVLNPTDPRPFFHSFGKVIFGLEPRHTFELQNRESKTLEIFNVQGGCSCTRIYAVDLVDESGEVLVKGSPRSPQEVLKVPPMGLVKFTVGMDTKKLKTPNNQKLEIVRMRTSSTLLTFPTFELHLETLQPFQITPQTLNMGEIPVNGGGAGVVTFVTKDYGGAARVLGIAEKDEGIEVSMVESVAAGGDLVWTFNVRAAGLQPLGAFRQGFSVKATDPMGEGDSGRHKIEVWGQVVPDVIPSPRLFSFKPLELGEEYVLRGKVRALIPGAYITILGHTVESEVADSIRVEYEAKAPNAEGASTEWSLHLTSLPSLPAGRFTGKVLLETDDAQNPIVEVPFSGAVQGN